MTTTNKHQPPPRRAVTKADKAVIVYFPQQVVDALDSAARAEDTDRSKFIRRAVRNMLEGRTA